MAILLGVALVAYNNLLNLWPRFRQDLYLPCNLTLAAILVAVARGPLGLESHELGLQGPHGPGLALGALLGAALAAPLFLAARHPRLAPRLADRRIEGMSASRLAYNVLLRIPLGTALLEELAFRGVLLAAWRSSGAWGAALASSIFFGLWHIAPSVNMASANRPGAAPGQRVRFVLATVGLTTVAGLALAWLRARSGGLALPVGLHATLNGLATLAAALALTRGRRCSLPAAR